MFVNSTYSRSFAKMHKNCPNCGQSFEPEPGFYTGAMYISYAIQVAIVLFVILSTNILYGEKELGWYLIWIIGLISGFFPIIFRMSRSIWIHMFVKHQSQINTNP
ncbi:MAG: DUF983 domain-containing protein [bacterium]|nr:DUF983 domain-containing protein [bacterium]